MQPVLNEFFGKGQFFGGAETFEGTCREVKHVFKMWLDHVVGRERKSFKAQQLYASFATLSDEVERCVRWKQQSRAMVCRSRLKVPVDVLGHSFLSKRFRLRRTHGVWR